MDTRERDQLRRDLNREREFIARCRRLAAAIRAKQREAHDGLNGARPAAGLAASREAHEMVNELLAVLEKEGSE